MGERGVKASIVVPVYNSSATLRECFDSLTSQTFEDFEVLVVDDGSSDESWEIVREYCAADGRFKGVRQQNAGPGTARNRALDRAKGDYVLCVDGDDWIDARLLEKAVCKAESSGADVVVWDAWFHNERTGARCLSSRVRVDVCEPDGYAWRDNPDLLFLSFQNWPWNKLIRRALLEEHGIRFQEDVMRTEDCLYTARALVKANFIVGIPEALSHYRMAQPDSAMAKTDETPFDCFRAFEALKSWLEAEGVYESLSRSHARWAFSGIVHNLKTVRALDTFKRVHQFMKDEGFERLGLGRKEAPMLLSEESLREYESFVASSPEEYLLSSFSREWRVREDEGVLAGQRWYEIEQLKREAGLRVRELEISLADEQRALQDACSELDELHARFGELEAAYHALENCMEQKIGKALCRIPRAVQRSCLRRRQRNGRAG